MTKAGYVDGFVLVVPKSKTNVYKSIASKAGKVWMKHGALAYYECIGDDMKPQWVTMTFPKLAKSKPSETVWFSFILYKSKKHRDQVNAKVMKDPFMTDPKTKDMPMPFDMARMSYGGFKTAVGF